MQDIKETDRTQSIYKGVIKHVCKRNKPITIITHFQIPTEHTKNNLLDT